MKKLLTAVAALAVALSPLAVAPAHAATIVNVDSFVVPDPSIGGCDMGNGIAFVGIEGVDWQVDGRPYEPTRLNSTLFLPEGFEGTVTASAEPGFELYEISAQRSGDVLSWEHVVTPTPRACRDLDACRAGATAAQAQLAHVTVERDALAERVARQGARIERQAATIKRLRAKIRSLR